MAAGEIVLKLGISEQRFIAGKAVQRYTVRVGQRLQVVARRERGNEESGTELSLDKNYSAGRGRKKWGTSCLSTR